MPAADKPKPKKVEIKVETKETPNLIKTMNDITFKNEQAKKIAAIQAGKERLKDKLAKNKQRKISSAAKISGLGKLKGI